MPRPLRPRRAVDTSSATARPVRGMSRVRRHDVAPCAASAGGAQSLRTRPRRNFAIPSRSKYALARALLQLALLQAAGARVSEAFAPLRAMGNRTSHMHASFMRAPFGREAIAAAQESAATTRHARRRPANAQRSARSASTRSRAATKRATLRVVQSSSLHALLTRLKRAAEFSSDKIAAALPAFHVINHVAGSCLEWLSRGALTRSEHER